MPRSCLPTLDGRSDRRRAAPRKRPLVVVVADHGETLDTEHRWATLRSRRFCTSSRSVCSCRMQGGPPRVVRHRRSCSRWTSRRRGAARPPPLEVRRRLAGGSRARHERTGCGRRLGRVVLRASPGPSPAFRVRDRARLDEARPHPTSPSRSTDLQTGPTESATSPRDPPGESPEDELAQWRQQTPPCAQPKLVQRNGEDLRRTRHNE